MAVQFNLLPWREQQRQYRHKRNRRLLWLGLGVGCVLGGVHYAREYHRLNDYQQALNFIQQRNHDLLPKLAEKKELDSLTATLHQQINAITHLQQHRRTVSDLLAEIAQANQQALFLTQLTLENDSLHLTGIGKDDTQIADFMKRLQGSNHLADTQLIDIVAHQVSDVVAKRFRLRSRVILPTLHETHHVD